MVLVNMELVVMLAVNVDIHFMIIFLRQYKDLIAFKLADVLKNIWEIIPPGNMQVLKINFVEIIIL